MPSKQHKPSFTYMPQKVDFLSCQLDHFLCLNEQLYDFILYYTSRPVRSSCSKQPSHTSQLYLPSQAETLDGERRKLKRKYSTLNSSMFFVFCKSTTICVKRHPPADPDSQNKIPRVRSVDTSLPTKILWNSIRTETLTHWRWPF